MGGLAAVEASGDLLAGRYRLDGKIGTGGWGIVYRAFDATTGDPVAIKILDRKKGIPASLEQRFAREIAAVQKLRSPHTVRLLDAGTLDDGSHYMVMEFLEGADLFQILAENVTLPVERAVRLVIQACAALGEAHSLGIVHRDLKPANLFVTRLPDGSECLKVLDFGISKLPQASMDELALTNTGTVLGSPVYMSPEQMTSSKSVDGRSDIWALGIVLYQLLSGGFPYEADGLPELCARVLTGEPLALSAQVKVAPELEAAVMRCLAKNPAKRFARVEDLAFALAPFTSGIVSAPTIIVDPAAPTPILAAGSRPVTSVRRRLPLPAPPLRVPTPTPPGVFVEPAPDPAERRSRRIRMTGAAVGLVAGIIYLVATWPRHDSAAAARPAPVQVAAPAVLIPTPPPAAAADLPTTQPVPVKKRRRRAPPERGAFDSPLPP